MRFIVLTILLCCSFATYFGSCEVTLEQPSYSTLLIRTRLPYVNDRKPETVTVPATAKDEKNNTEGVDPIRESKNTKKALKKRKSPRQRVSPTGDDFLLLDLLRYSAYEFTIINDALLVSNTSGPFIIGKPKTPGSTSVEIADLSKTAIEVPHIVQVWSVRVPTHEGGQWLTNPDATATHYFAIEHAATTEDRSAVTGWNDLTSERTSTQKTEDILPFAIRGHSYRASPVTPLWWVGAINALRSGPVGTYYTAGATYVQEQLLAIEHMVTELVTGEASPPIIATRPLECNTMDMPACGGEGFAVSEAVLSSLLPKSALAGSFVVTLRFEGARGDVELRGNYSFHPTNGFIPNIKLDVATSANPHNYFDYSLSFSATGPIEQKVVSEGKASSSIAVPTCTHYRAIAQYDKKHLVLTTYWQEGSGDAAKIGQAMPCQFEKSIILSLQETAGSDVRFASGSDELDDDERQRFRFVLRDDDDDGDAFLRSDSVSAKQSLASLFTFSSPDSASQTHYVTPKLRRMPVGKYYNSSGIPSRSGSYTDFLIPKSFGSRARRLGPTILLLIVVTLVKFGPRLYLNWLDARQQKRKGALGVTDALKVLEGETLATGRRRGNDGNGSISAAAAAAKELAKEKAKKKNYGSGEHLAKAEAILKEHMANNPNWKKEYEEAMSRRKPLTQKEKEEYQKQQAALLEQMKREDGLL